MDRHVALLAVLTRIWGGLGLVLGLSMVLLAIGALLEVADPMRTSSEFLAVVTTVGLSTIGAFALLWGAAHLGAARLLARRSPRGRVLALALAVVNLLVLPFGTVFGAYAMWVLLSESGRRLFEPPR